MQLPSHGRRLIALYSASGRSIYPEAGSPSLMDIAQGLSRTCRFSGQAKHWYCVLAHTNTVASLVPSEYRLHALLHDAPEAVVSDVVTTWKSSMASFNENILLDRIYFELGVPSIKKDFKAMAAVKRADRIALCVEAKIIGHSFPDHPDFHMDITPQENDLAHSWTNLQLETGPQPWINLEFVDNYVERVQEEVHLCAVS